MKILYFSDVLCHTGVRPLDDILKPLVAREDSAYQWHFTHANNDIEVHCEILQDGLFLIYL